MPGASASVAAGGRMEGKGRQIWRHSPKIWREVWREHMKREGKWEAHVSKETGRANGQGQRRREQTSRIWNAPFYNINTFHPWANIRYLLQFRFAVIDSRWRRPLKKRCSDLPPQQHQNIESQDPQNRHFHNNNQSQHLVSRYRHHTISTSIIYQNKNKPPITSTNINAVRPQWR